MMVYSSRESSVGNDDLLTVLVAGGGAWVERSSLMWRMVIDELDSRNINRELIDGVYRSDNGELSVTPPGHQLSLISSIIESSAKKSILLIAQCLGTVAAMSALETYGDHKEIKMLSIAPPLPSPGATLSTNRSSAKRRQQNGSTVTSVCTIGPEYNFNSSNLSFEDAIVPPEYLSQHSEQAGFASRLQRQVDLGRASLIVPLDDWNSESPTVCGTWQGSILRLPQTGHSLNSSDKGLSLDKAIEVQRDNVKAVLDQGIGLIERQ